MAIAVREVQRQFPGIPALNPRYIALGTLAGVAFKTYRPKLVAIRQRVAAETNPAAPAAHTAASAPVAGAAPAPHVEPWFTDATTAPPARH